MKSRFFRIIIIGDDDQGMREFAISRALIWILGAVGLLLALALGYVFMTYGTRTIQARRIPVLEADLDRAQGQLALVDSLNAELQVLGAMQEQMLHVLGIEPVAPDTGLTRAGGRDVMSDLAAAVVTPPPDAWPAAGYITQEFSDGRVQQGQRPHLGLDIAGPEGAPILAAGDGAVVRSGTDAFLGNFVEIQHGMGYLTVYGHCREVAVTRGAQVRRGQLIAYMGATGEASAPHLHFEVWQHGTAVDPRRFLQGEPPQP